MANPNKNRAMIPVDCSDVLYKQTSIGLSTTNSTTIKDINLTLSSITLDSIRPFELAGEFYITCTSSNISYYAQPSTDNQIKTYSLKCRLKFDNVTASRLRYIRFAFKPGVSFKNTGVANCKFGIDIYISIGNIDKRMLSLVSTNEIQPNGIYTTGIYKFIYNIENDFIEEDIYELSLDL